MADSGAESTISKRLVDLRVVDLKVELENRSLEKTGVKQALLERLKRALLEEGQNPETFIFKVSTPGKVQKKTESHQENAAISEDICSDTSDLISIGYETDEKDMSLEICHIIDEDIPDNEETRPGEDSVTNEDKCEHDILDEDLSFQDDDPIKLCIDENPVDIPEILVKCSSPISEDKNNSLNSSNDPPLSTSEQQSLEPKENSNQTSSPIIYQSEKNIEEPKVENDSALPKEMKEVVAMTLLENKESSSISEGTIKEVLTFNGDNFPKSQNSSKPSEGHPEVDPNAMKSEKSSNQASKSQGNGHNLWVSGLSSSTRATDLKNLFSKYGKVTGAKVVTNAKSPGSKCYGFVTMASSDEASKCIQHLHRTELHGRMISVERAKADPSQVTIDKKLGQSIADKGKEEGNKTESTSRSTHQVQEKSRERKDGSVKHSNAERKPERPTNRSSRRRSRDRHGDNSMEILTLDKIREERERERGRQWERIRRKEEKRQQMMLQRERERQRDVERLQREEAERLAREREKLRLEKQRLELDRLKAERERVALEREKQRRERERLEQEREERRRELQRHERGTKRPADSSSYWSESKRTALSPHSMRTHGIHQKPESTHRASSQFFDKKRDERIKHVEKLRRDIEVVVDHGKQSRKANSPKIAWRPCNKLSVSPTRHHSSREIYAAESQGWHTNSSASRNRTYESSAVYGQPWSDGRQLLSSSRTWSSTNETPSSSFLSSANILMSSGRVHSDASRYDAHKHLSSSRRY